MGAYIYQGNRLSGTHRVGAYSALLKKIAAAFKWRWVRIGVNVILYYWIEERLHEVSTPPLREESKFTFEFLDASALKAIFSMKTRLFPGRRLEYLLKKLQEGSLCFGVKYNNEYVAWTWIKLDEGKFEGKSFPLQSHEAYLEDIFTIEQFRGYYPHPLPLDEILEVIGITELRRTRVRKLSGGQQRRLDVAVGLAGDPDLLFLDEPTTGFDPSARRSAWEMVKGLQSLGKTVFLTTHYMDEAEYLADRVAIIVQGEIVAEGAPGELGRGDATTTIEFRLDSGASILPEGLPVATKGSDGRFNIQTDTPTNTLYELTRWATERGIELEELSVSRPSLEDIFVELVRPAADRGTE